MKKQTILFVDDEQPILSALSFAFQRHYNILTAQDGYAAIDIVKANDVQVVVSDQRMPEMLGHELLRHVKEINPDIVRILLTGYSDLQGIVNSVNTGEVFRFVSKPWNTDRLRETIALGCEMNERFQKARQAVQAKPALSSKPHVLFVDTNHLHLAALNDLFAQDYQVHLAGSVSEAFRVLATTPVAALITEVNLADADGVDFLVLLHEQCRDVVPILISDSQDSETAIRLINEGQVFRYFIKPFQRKAIQESLKLAIEKHFTEAAEPAAESSLRITPVVSPLSPAALSANVSLAHALASARKRLQMRPTY